MFGLGMGELIVIFIVALIVLGPARLPKLAQDLGKAIREFRKAADDMKQELAADEDLKGIKGTFQELKDSVTLTPEEIRAREDFKKQLEANAAEQERAEAQALAAQAAAGPAPKPATPPPLPATPPPLPDPQKKPPKS
jgi:sec-independent protein translocase protein TatB